MIRCPDQPPGLRKTGVKLVFPILSKIRVLFTHAHKYNSCSDKRSDQCSLTIPFPLSDGDLTTRRWCSQERMAQIGLYPGRAWTWGDNPQSPQAGATNPKMDRGLTVSQNTPQSSHKWHEPWQLQGSRGRGCPAEVHLPQVQAPSWLVQNRCQTLGCVPNAQRDQTNWNIRFWNRKGFVVESSKIGKLVLRRPGLPSGFQARAFKDSASREGCRMCEQLADLLLLTGWWWNNRVMFPESYLLVLAGLESTCL